MRRASGDDLLVLAPLLEDVGAVADEVLGARPPRVAALIERAEFFQRGNVHGIPCIKIERVEQERRGLRERKLEGVRIDGLEADLGEILQLAVVVVLRAGDVVVEHVGILRRERGREHALVSLDEIVGGERIAIGPLGVLAQVKRVDESIGRDVPTLGDARHDVHLRILGDEALVKGEHQVMLRDAGDRVRVEILGFALIAEVEDLFGSGAAGAGGGVAGFVFRTTDGACEQETGEQNTKARHAGEHGGKGTARVAMCKPAPG